MGRGGASESRSRAPDVVVVGGGVAGASIAFRLAADGWRVLLLERRGSPPGHPAATVG